MMATHLFKVAVVVLSIAISSVTARPGGAPSQACATLIPGHTPNTAIDPTVVPPPYFIVTDLVNQTEYEPDEIYNISLVAVGGALFRGFLIQAHDATNGTGLIGTFIENSTDIQLLTCGSNDDSSVTHTNNNDKTSISFQWMAPSGSEGSVDFRYSVVQQFDSFYANLSAADFPVSCNISRNTDVDDFPLIFRSSDNCLRENCQYLVGLGPNPSDSSYLDVYLEGNALGWIAIGFSLNQLMDNDDVLGCRVNSGVVTVVDTWNPSPRQSPNVLDSTQNGLCIQSTAFTNGRITCRFSRLINNSNVGQDYDLDNMFYLLFGRRAADQGSVTNLAYHTINGGMTPTVSMAQVNPVRDSNAMGRCPIEANDIDAHPLVFGVPDGCSRTSCQYYVGLGPNPSDSSYLDVYLEGNALGWIAIGFSINQLMNNDDVLGCRVNSGVVTVVDTWNPSPRHSPNVLDSTQDGLCVQSTAFTNGRITCRFSRLINSSNVGQDYDLDNMFYLLFGRRAADQGSVTNLAYHTINGGMTPTVSMARVNPVRNRNTRGVCPLGATAVDSHPLVFGIPDGCSRTSCQYYVGLGPNPSDSSYLDVYLEGNASGWIAIGFSLNRTMDNDDVLGCRVNSGVVTVVDTWNPSPRQSPNVLDSTQNGLCVQSTAFTNGRITCRFSRTINITNTGQDYNLNNSFYLLFGRRMADQGSATNLGYHTINGGMTPTVSMEQVNPVRDMGGCPPSPNGTVVYTFTQRSSVNDYFFGARVNPVNPDYLDMTLEANAEGWVGIGFSLNAMMEADDVLACQRSPTDDMVTVVDTWNPSPQYTPNQGDPNQNGLCPYTAQFVNGRISCTFSRLIAPVNPGFDRDLSDNLFQFYATSNVRGSGSLAQHTRVPVISASSVAILNSTGVATDDFPVRPLTKVHGILMILAWPLLVVSAIFFAAWMKPALPNGEWFQVHRAFMIVSLALTALGFIFIFVANARNTAVSPGLISFNCGQNTSHFVIGFLVFILQIINPIMALFRCKPTDSKRWIFNLFHGSLVGFIAELLALVNVGLGIALFESGGCTSGGADTQYTILWVYIGFVAFLLLVQLVLFIIFTIVTLRAPAEGRKGLSPPFLKYFFSSTTSWSPPQGKDIEMTNPQDKKKSDDPPPKKEPSEDSSIRWGGFGVFIIGTFGLLIAVIIMIAIAE